MGATRNKSNRTVPTATARRKALGVRHVTLLVAIGVLIGAGGHEFFRPAGVETATNRTGPESARLTGPWGEIEVTPMVLERPDEILDDLKRTEAIRWKVPRESWSEVEALVRACGLTEAQAAAFLDRKLWQQQTNGWEVAPPVDWIRGLNETAREKLYSALAESPENPQHYPFIFREDHFDDLFRSSDLPDDKIALVRHLAYRKRGVLHFADGQAFELLTSSNETRRLFKALSQVPTVLARLRLKPDSDLDALLAYWGGRGRADELKPLFRSLAKVPGGGSINISYLLPPVPRVRLYTYPKPAKGPRPDCFWTSFSFFGERPGYRLGDERYNQELLDRDYIPWHGERKMGDVMILVEDDMALHACTYIAGDIYFTKNGRDANQPWVFMRMKDIMAEYGSGRTQSWKVYRRKAT